MNLVFFGIIFLIITSVPITVFGDDSEYCKNIDDEIICEISILSNKYPLPDYTPDVANIPKDAKIIFKNDGFMVHTATSTDASPNDNTHLADKGINGIFDTGKLLAGEIAPPIVLHDEGTYHYFCTVHKEMRGTLIVFYDNPENEILFENDSNIPVWIKNNAGWWADGIISDAEFVLGLKFLIENKILEVPDVVAAKYSIDNIPQWIKSNAKWWAEGQINDSEFILTIQHLIKKNIVQITPTEKTLQSIPATSGAIVNFYVNDEDLNTSQSGIDRISTDGLIVATINDQSIPIPSEMIETKPNSGRFYLKIELPQSINGEALSQDDIIEVRYFDQSDSTGQMRTIVSSTTLTSSFAKIQTQGNNQRIGHDFILRIYEPDANSDSKDEDRIPLSALEFRAEGGIRVPLSDSAFDANSSFLIEIGPNSDIFEVEIKIPRKVDGKTIHIGDWYEIRYIDSSTPSNTAEKIIFKGRIG